MAKSRISLKSIQHIRLEMSKVYRDAKAGKMDIDKAKTLSLILKRIGDLIISSDLESRIAALEIELSKGRKYE